MKPLISATKAWIRRVSYWIVPLGLESFFRLKLRHFLPAKLKHEIKKNEKFRGKHKGDRCFILATGPSIAKQDLTMLRDEKCIAVSQFYLHSKARLIDPLYHVEAPNHPPYGTDFTEKLMAGFRRHYSDRTQYFFGHTFYEHSFFSIFQANKDLKPKNAFFINYAGSNQLNEHNCDDVRYWDITQTPFTGRSVVYCAIQLAVFMGFSKIYLLGCDHDYFQRFSNREYQDHHFYSDAEGGIEGVASYLSNFTMEQWFEEYYFRWKQYRLMKEYLSTRGQLIFNATEGGMLDVFPRVNLEDIIHA